MSVDIGKPADQVIKDAQKDIQAAFPDDASKSKASGELVNKIDSEEVKKKAYEDVKHLADTIRNIRVNFIKVAGDLVGFDAADFKDTNQQPIKLGPKWQPYIKEFDDTLQYSLEQATDAIAMMKNIAAILGDTTPDLKEDLKSELNDFKETLKKREADALQVRNKFQSLADNVKLFSAEVDAALDRADAAIQADLTKAQNHLTDLERELKEVKEKITSLSIATASELAVGGTAAIVAVCTLNPVAIVLSVGALLSAIGTGIALKQAVDQRDRCQSDIEKTNREIQTLEDRKALAAKYRQSLGETKIIVHSISDQIAVIANIWQTINLDMHELHEQVSKLSEAKMNGFFMAKLKTAKKVYEHLTYLLETYVEQVHAAEQKP